MGNSVKTRFQMLMASLMFVTVTLVTSNQLIRQFAWTRTNVISLVLVLIVFVIIKLKTVIIPPAVSPVHVKTVTKTLVVPVSVLTLTNASLAPPAKEPRKPTMDETLRKISLQLKGYLV